MVKSKFFRVFVEGFTAGDGRKIEAQWIDDIVATFNAATYPVRINCEHIKGFSPEPPFNAYGDVTAVRAQTDEIEIDGEKRRCRALYAQIAPNDQLIAINRKGQKLYTSVEISPDFAGTGKTGLVGLAVTDNPASLGTEALSFSALKPMFDARKQSPANLFSAAIEADIELEADASGVAEAIATGFARVAALFSRQGGEGPGGERPTGAGAREAPTSTTAANDNGLDLAAFSAALGQQVAAAVKPVSDDLAALRGRFDSLKTTLEKTEQTGFSRGPATGASAEMLTDC